MSFRYGFYLRPDFAMSHGVAQFHQLLKAQYNFSAAGRLMPHLTIKGFFRTEADADEIVDKLDEALDGLQPFPVHNDGIIPFGPHSIVVSLKYHADGSPNTTLYDLQECVWSAVTPLIDPRDEFSPHDPRGLDGPNPFHPHISLVMAELHPDLEQEVLEFLRAGADLLPGQFVADTFTLYRFEADWEQDWAKTVKWEWVHSWHVYAD